MRTYAYMCVYVRKCLVVLRFAEVFRCVHNEVKGVGHWHKKRRITRLYKIY